MFKINIDKGYFEGEKIYLKAIDKEHLEEYHEKSKTMTFETCLLTGYKNLSTKSALEGYLDNVVNRNDRFDFFIMCKSGDRIIGELALNDIDRSNRTANIRLCLYDEKDFNKGYGSEALLLALNFGFGMQDLNRIELDVYDFNDRAVHVYEKLGFKKEGIKREVLYINYKYYDAISMSMLKREFIEKYVSVE